MKRLKCKRFCVQKGKVFQAKEIDLSARCSPLQEDLKNHWNEEIQRQLGEIEDSLKTPENKEGREGKLRGKLSAEKWMILVQRTSFKLLRAIHELLTSILWKNLKECFTFIK